MDVPRLPPRLCVCVDDFGLHAGINAAALHLAARGRVHAVACQVGGPAWLSGAASLRRLEGVDVGLHLDLTECPLTLPARPLRHVILASLLHRLDEAALACEIGAQLDRFEADLGPPDFVDGHQHVHQLPQVRDALLAALQQRGWRPWLRSTRRPGAAVADGFKPWLIERLGACELARLAAEAGLRQNRALLGVYDFQLARPGFAALLPRWLAAARDGDLLMCHPSRGVGAATDALLAARKAEFDLLDSIRFDVLMRTHPLQLAPLSLTLADAPR